MHRELLEHSVQTPRLPQTETHKPARRGWKVWVSFIDSCLHTCVFFPGLFPPKHRHGALEKGRLRARARNAGCSSLAGMFSPGRMQSFKMEFHWGFETLQGGGRRGSLPQHSHSVQATLSLSKSIPDLGPLGGSEAHPPSHGRFFNLCHLHTPASAGPPVRESALR